MNKKILAVAGAVVLIGVAFSFFRTPESWQELGAHRIRILNQGDACLLEWQGPTSGKSALKIPPPCELSMENGKAYQVTHAPQVKMGFVTNFVPLAGQAGKCREYRQALIEVTAEGQAKLFPSTYINDFSGVDCPKEDWQKLCREACYTLFIDDAWKK